MIFTLIFNSINSSGLHSDRDSDRLNLEFSGISRVVKVEHIYNLNS